MKELYSIIGIFYEDLPDISPWAGYFIRSMNEGEERIEGTLTDIHGISRITGTMNTDLLKFRKQYRENRGNPIDYKFSFENGIWIGAYTSTSRDYDGKSICKTNLFIPDLSLKKSNKSIINSIIKNNQFEAPNNKINSPKHAKETIAIF